MTVSRDWEPGGNRSAPEIYPTNEMKVFRRIVLVPDDVIYCLVKNRNGPYRKLSIYNI